MIVYFGVFIAGVVAGVGLISIIHENAKMKGNSDG